MTLESAPERGDLVWISFNPQAGHEQAGRRPAVVISPISYNAKRSLALFCPVTSKIKGYHFEVALSLDLPVHGVVLTDQVRSLDWRARGAEPIGRVSNEVMEEILKRIRALV